CRHYKMVKECNKDIPWPRFVFCQRQVAAEVASSPLFRPCRFSQFVLLCCRDTQNHALIRKTDKSRCQGHFLLFLRSLTYSLHAFVSIFCFFLEVIELKLFRLYSLHFWR